MSLSHSGQSNRGWTRGRGRRATPSFAPSFHPSVVEDTSTAPKRDILDGLIVTSAVATLHVPISIPDHASTDVEIRNLECIASYDWLESKVPTILVPSSPPEWMGDPQLPLTLDPDVRTQVLNHNQYRLPGPASAILPVIKAADAMNKAVDWPSVDFVVNRNSLSKLLRWIRGSSRKDDGGWHDFRIDLELVGDKTVVFIRWEARDREASTGRSYGLNFEQATTSPAKGCERGTTGHHRILKYDLLGMTFVVRSQVDACLPPESANPETGGESVAFAQPAVDDLAASISNLKLVNSDTTATTPPSPPTAPPSAASPYLLRVIRAGREVPQNAIIELTSRSAYWLREMRWGDIYPGLYLTQTPHFYIGLHSRGTFSEVQKRTLTDKQFIAHKQEVDVSLRKLGEVLEAIQRIAVEHGREKHLSLVCVAGELKVYESVSTESCLPEDTRRRFETPKPM
ncbi:hypothetical protein FA95DRAFT_1497247 [Auriscalpium vulgare]|uniref:Uncharacterized protein n=1 Tax=Auriscalpium vulgare TaxID=40419 RepID=A0ACB8RKF3_9AGAM|nr:hypothetical protein FA95DRAFT_1497247 [Auriscalpium vulgare]